MKENNPHILGTEKVGKLLLEYSIPAIIGMTLTSLYNILIVYLSAMVSAPWPYRVWLFLFR